MKKLDEEIANFVIIQCANSDNDASSESFYVFPTADLVQHLRSASSQESNDSKKHHRQNLSALVTNF